MMTNNTILTLEEIEAKTLWVAKMQGWRQVGTYAELEDLIKSEECRDHDICCEQPEELKPFYDKYFAYERENGWITIPEYYKDIYLVEVQSEAKTTVKISQAEFDHLVGLCSSYDPFTQYIDDYGTEVRAERRNHEILDKFKEIMSKYNVEVSFLPTYNKRLEELREDVTKWLAKQNIVVEEEPEEVCHKSKRVWTEEEIKTLVQTNDKVLYGALKNLYACQTADEQTNSTTTHANGAGFNALDAEYLTSVAQFLIKKGYLTDKQKACTRKKLVKYNKQLTRLANV